MKLQPGDKVRFLNEALEGIVSKILVGDRVEVTDEFGFIHTAYIKALVKEEFTHSESSQPKSYEEEAAVQETSGKKKSRPSLAISSPGDDETVYANLRLMKEDSPLTSDIEVSIFNNCSYIVLFSVSKKNGDICIGISTAALQPGGEMQIGVYSQDELHRFEGFAFQFLFSKNGEFKPRPSAEKILRFSSSDFVDKENHFSVQHEGHQHLLIPLYVVGREADVDLKKLLERYRVQDEEANRKRMAAGKRKLPGTTTLSSRPGVFSKEKVVDLHIEELLKDYSGMSNAQIISYQINYFLYEMDRAAINHLHKITFIHGVGEGVLKSALREELKKFPNVRFSDAPVEKFGYGATEVLL